MIERYEEIFDDVSENQVALRHGAVGKFAPEEVVMVREGVEEDEDDDESDGDLLEEMK